MGFWKNCSSGSGIFDGYDCIEKVQELSKGVLIMLTSEREEHLCTGRYFLPIFPSEELWNSTGRAFVYFILIIFMFIGVALVSDKFMAAIEVITAKERTVIRKDPQGNDVESRVLIWNPTIANLSLMAFGSSAPEILLSLVEVLNHIQLKSSGDFVAQSDEGLGPSTIVGSAAFNLLIITGACIFVVPKGETRSIEKYGVFVLTSLFSLFAYVWMVIVLTLWTPNVVTQIEALLTLLFFPLLLSLSYIEDRRFTSIGNKVMDEVHGIKHVHPDFVRVLDLGSAMNGKKIDPMKQEILDLLKQQPHLNLSNKEDIASAATASFTLKSNFKKAAYRIQAMRLFYAPSKFFIGNKSLSKRLTAISAQDSQSKAVVSDKLEEYRRSEVFFLATSYQVVENAGHVQLFVSRKHGFDSECSVSFETSNGKALAGEDFDHTAGIITFKKGEKVKDIKVRIIDDNKFEPDESFFVVLKTPLHDAVLGTASVAEVTIIDDDKPGDLSFEQSMIAACESEKSLKIKLLRRNGVDGKLTVQLRTVDQTAVCDKDYCSIKSETVEFLHGEAERVIEIDLINTKTLDKRVSFAVEFEIQDFPRCGANYGANKIVTVEITGDRKFQEAVNEIAALMKANLDFLHLTTTWKQQFIEALDASPEEGNELSALDIFVHFFALPFKLLTAMIPPADWYGGWPTFIISLAFCGVLTTIVGDMAGIFGCLVGVPNGITAITFVALGTSLPDTFASMIAAENDETADAAIGNVTGSNSVNVFVGLGLPWVLATFILGELEVPAGQLTSSVVVFLFCAIALFAILGYRRFNGLGELGGGRKLRMITGSLCIFLWFIYILFSFLIYSGVF